MTLKKQQPHCDPHRRPYGLLPPQPITIPTSTPGLLPYCCGEPVIPRMPEEAWQRDPKIDHQFDYETDYLEDPSRSFFRLERRHAASVLCDRTVAMFGRINRAKDALLDPRFHIPKDFHRRAGIGLGELRYQPFSNRASPYVRRSPLGTPVSRSCTMHPRPARRVPARTPSAIRGTLPRPALRLRTQRPGIRAPGRHRRKRSSTSPERARRRRAGRRWNARFKPIS